MKTGYSNSGWHPLYITEKHIRRLSETMDNFVRDEEESETNCYWNVTLSNNKTINDITTEQVINLANGYDSKIRGISIWGEGRSSYYTRASVVLADDYWSVSANGKESLVNLFQKEVEGIIIDMKPWWCFLRRFLFWEILGALLGLAVFALIMYTFTLESDWEEKYTLIFLLFAFCIFICVWITDFLQKSIFPGFSCLIGEGVKRANHLKYFRIGIFTIMTSIIVPFLVSYFT